MAKPKDSSPIANETPVQWPAVWPRIDHSAMVKALTDATEAYLRAQARAAATFAETGEVVSLAALRERVLDLTDILAGASLVRQASQSATSTGFQNRGTDPNRLTSGQLDGLCSRLAAERAESSRPKF